MQSQTHGRLHLVSSPKCTEGYIESRGRGDSECQPGVAALKGVKSSARGETLFAAAAAPAGQKPGCIQLCPVCLPSGVHLQVCGRCVLQAEAYRIFAFLCTYLTLV